MVLEARANIWAGLPFRSARLMSRSMWKLRRNPGSAAESGCELITNKLPFWRELRSRNGGAVEACRLNNSHYSVLSSLAAAQHKVLAVTNLVPFMHPAGQVRPLWSFI